MASGEHRDTKSLLFLCHLDVSVTEKKAKMILFTENFQRLEILYEV